MLKNIIDLARKTIAAIVKLLTKDLRQKVCLLEDQVLFLQKRTLPLILDEEKDKSLVQPLMKTTVRNRGKLNVLQISTFDKLGGAAMVAWRLHNGLKNQQHQSTMMVKEKFSYDSAINRIEGSEKDRLFYEICRKEGWQYWNILSSFDIAQTEQFQTADIVHFHNLHGDYFNYFALPGLTKQKPALWTLHDMQALTGHCAQSMECNRWEKGCQSCPDLNAGPAIEKDTARSLFQQKQMLFAESDMEIAVPSRWLLDITAKSMLKEKRTHLTYNGVDVELFKPSLKEEARRALNIPEEKTVIITSAAGGLKNPYKGSDYIRSALKRCGQKNNLLLVSLGGANTVLEGIECIGTGHLFEEKDVARWYSASDIFLYPTLADNFPQVVIEAMSCGLPIVTFDTGGIPEQVEHLKSGYIARQKDEDDLYKGLALFIDEKVLRAKAGVYAREKVKRDFSSAGMVNSYIQLYKEIIERREKAHE